MSDQKYVVVPVELKELLASMVELHDSRGTVLTVQMHQLGEMLAAAPQPAEQAVEQSVIAGALFDFLGFLTSRDSNTTFGATSLASPAVDLLSEWAETRSLALDDADVINWQSHISAAPPFRLPDFATDPDDSDEVASLWDHGFKRGWNSCLGVLAKTVQPTEKQAAPDVAGLVEALERAVGRLESAGLFSSEAAILGRAALAAHRKGEKT